MERITARKALYIKLGRGGKWEDRCLSDGTMRFGYPEVSHEVARSADFAQIRDLFIAKGHKPGTATRHAQNVLSFYYEPADTLWITFANGFLWWCFARPGVEFISLDASIMEESGTRFRQTVNGWHNTSLTGQPLRISELNGALTRVAAYRMTICSVQAHDYLIRKINGEDLPEVTEAHAARVGVIKAIGQLIRLLTWADFELLVELVFSASGWRRIGATGGTQKTVDLELTLPSTGERAFVQVKSKTDQVQLEHYLEHLAARDEDKMFFVYHSADSPLAAIDPRLVLIDRERLSDMVLDAGLFDWLVRKVG